MRRTIAKTTGYSSCKITLNLFYNPYGWRCLYAEKLNGAVYFCVGGYFYLITYKRKAPVGSYHTGAFHVQKECKFAVMEGLLQLYPARN